MKYSKGFNETYEFYHRNRRTFNFCGTLNPSFEAIPNGGIDAKQVFFYIESNGVNKPTNEPQLLNELLLCKAGVNFQIKQWAESRLDGTLPFIELDYEYAKLLFPKASPCYILEWVNGEPIKHLDIKTQYGLPNWVIDAVEGQVHKERKKAAP